MPRAAATAPTLIFVHLPKTGGTTLKDVIHRYYGRRAVWEAEAGRIPESVRAFGDLPDAERARFRAVVGHIPVGIDALVPGPSAYVTMLRDPVERVLSNYFYVKQAPQHRRHEAVVSGRQTLEELLEPWANVQVRRLCVQDLRSAQYGRAPADRAMLDEAKRNLRTHFAVVGLCERFDESLALVAEHFAWAEVPGTRRLNTTRDRPEASEIDASLRRRIEAQNELDRELHAYAVELLEERLRAGGAALAQRMADLQRRSERAGRLQRPLDLLRYVVPRDHTLRRWWRARRRVMG